jgi:hypothetical protein
MARDAIRVGCSGGCRVESEVFRGREESQLLWVIKCIHCNCVWSNKSSCQSNPPCYNSRNIRATIQHRFNVLLRRNTMMNISQAKPTTWFLFETGTFWIRVQRATATPICLVDADIGILSNFEWSGKSLKNRTGKFTVSRCRHSLPPNSSSRHGRQALFYRNHIVTAQSHLPLLLLFKWQAQHYNLI